MLYTVKKNLFKVNYPIDFRLLHNENEIKKIHNKNIKSINKTFHI